MTKRPWRRWMLTALLWLGLLLCAMVLRRYGADVAGVLGRLHGGIVAACIGLMLVILLAGASAWVQTVRAIAGVHLSVAAALRQVGMLLVGKYIPGGVFGFLARVYDSDHADARGRLVAAGLFEQALGLFTVTASGLVLWTAAFWRQPAALLGLAVVPPVAMAICRLAFAALRRMGWQRLQVAVDQIHEASAERGRLLRTAWLTQVTVLGWAAIVALVAGAGFGLDPMAALGVAGGFSLAVTAGMLALFAPGGIGVREAGVVLLSGPWLDAPTALVLAAALRILSVAFDLFAGGVALLVGAARTRPAFLRHRDHM